MDTSIKGGVNTYDDHIQINMEISGGKTQSRNYCNTVDLSINRLNIINEALNKIPIEDESNAIFYLNELINLFSSVNLNFVNNFGNYQIIHNINILNNYMISCIKTINIEEVLQLIDCNRMIEEFNKDCCYKKLIKVENNIKLIDEIQYLNIDEIVIPVRKLRFLFNEYVKLIESKKNLIEKSYLDRINKIKDMFSK